MKKLLSLAAAAALLSASALAAPPKDIVDTAAAAGTFKSLAAALQAAGLVETLRGSGPYTVFAPTDEAFAKIPKADLDALLRDVPKLKTVLMYHVFVGNASSADLRQLKDLSMAQGGRLKIDKSNGLTVDGAKIVAPDVAASNGVIHVIDTVLMPK
ncbi:MAG: fasciclin domain-containing protein [Vicinamibacteria bacterium]|nr:fasciclin domain-containing protein [Vicinamibacteria bacterium]